MEKKLFVLTTLLITLLLFFPGCKSSSETNNTPEPVVRNANIAINAFTTVATRDDSGNGIGNVQAETAQLTLIGEPAGDSDAGYVYEMTLSLKETAGASGTITAVEFWASQGGTAFGYYSADVSNLFGTTIIAGNGSLSANLNLSADASYPYADEMKVKVSWSSSSGATGSIEAIVNNPILEDADIIVQEDTLVQDRKSYKSCYLAGFVYNAGYYTAWNVKVTFTAYGEGDVILDTASGFPADLGDIPAGVSAKFEAIFFDITKWSTIKKYTWKTEWLTRSGSTAEKEGTVFVN